MSNIAVSILCTTHNHEKYIREALDSLVQAAVAGGLSNMTIGIYDAELLRRAQKEPENYKDVIVRVWGFSARFVKLSEEMQEHVISRIPQVP